MKILVVDDNIDFADTMKDLLELRGHQTGVAYSGAEAVARARSEEFDLILMDLVMPGKDGEVALQELRECEITTPTMIMTAFSEEDHLNRARRMGATYCFTKPIDFDKLEKAIAQIKT